MYGKADDCLVLPPLPRRVMAATSSHLDIAEVPVPIHKRTYQACIPCRRRKVRCDLGSVDTPHDPPCVRCRREKKDCFFSETRRKRKVEDGDGRRIDDLDEEYIARNRRSQAARNGSLGGGGDSQDGMTASPSLGIYADGSSWTGNGNHNEDLSSTYPRPSPSRPTSTGARGQEVTNETAAALFQSQINNPGDALHLLLEAADRTGDLDGNAPLSPEDKHHGKKQNQRGAQAKAATTASYIDPEITYDSGKDPDSPAYRTALQLWSRLRFVRAGWFTAKEAIDYISYYYEHMAPLAPVSPPNFSSPRDHQQLLTEEPMLTVTLLTIAARYKPLEGPGGRSRSFLVHENLWIYLQGMITRMFWGQEQFGGGFCGAGAHRRWMRAGPITGGFRNLGTVESLLLLSEWHPRSMHFSPINDDDELLVPLPFDPSEHDSSALLPKTNTYEDWTEPALRSDRMCWSLIGCAYALAFELGVFDSLATLKGWCPQKGATSQRQNRIGRLLHVYVSQIAGRLGYPNMLPYQDRNTRTSYFEMNIPNGPSNEPRSSNDVLSSVQRAWAEITTLMRITNAELFASKATTREMIQSRRYLEHLKEFGPLLKNWLARFETISVPAPSRTILLMEYEYTRTYLNSLSLQAVLEECANKPDSNITSDLNGANFGITSSSTPSSKLVHLYKENEPYILEVVDASRKLLRHVVGDLEPKGHLRHASVRTHFRILSGAVFLLKTFAVQAKEEEVMISIKLLDKTVHALRDSVVDDVHLCLRIADLLESLTSSIRNKFVRLAPTGKTTSKRHSNNNHSHRPSKSQNGLRPNTADSKLRGGGRALSLHQQKDHNNDPYTTTPTAGYSALQTPTMQGPYSNHHPLDSSPHTHNPNPNPNNNDGNNNSNDEPHFLPQPDFMYTSGTNDDDLMAAYPYPGHVSSVGMGPGGPSVDDFNQLYPQTVSPDPNPFLYPETLSESAAAAASLRTWLRLVNQGQGGS